MFKKLLVTGLVIVLIGLAAWNYFRPTSLHRPVKVEDIAHITLSGFGSSREATDQEIKNIVTWYNAASDIRENKDFAGTTADSGIIVYKQNGERFIISRSGSDFEVQRKDSKGKNHSYWARQPNIKSLLDDLAKQK